MIGRASTILVLDPTVEPLPDDVQLAPRPAALDGLCVGLLDNGKRGVTRFLDHLEAVLAERHRDVKNRAKAVDPRIAAELVHLLEAVADRAKQAAEAADGVGASTRQAVLDAHGAISALESDVDSPKHQGGA